MLKNLNKIVDRKKKFEYSFFDYVIEVLLTSKDKNLVDNAKKILNKKRDRPIYQLINDNYLSYPLLIWHYKNDELKTLRNDHKEICELLILPYFYIEEMVIKCKQKIRFDIKECLIIFDLMTGCLTPLECSDTNDFEAFVLYCIMSTVNFSDESFSWWKNEYLATT